MRFFVLITFYVETNQCCHTIEFHYHDFEVFFVLFHEIFYVFEKSRRKDKDLCTITELFAKLKDFYRWLPIRSCSFVKKGRRAEIFYKTKQIAFIFSTLTETSFLERQLEFIPLSLIFLKEFQFIIVNFQIQFRYLVISH